MDWDVSTVEWLVAFMICSVVFATAAWHYGLRPGEEGIYSYETREAMRGWGWPLWLLVNGALLFFVLLNCLGALIHWALTPVRWCLVRIYDALNAAEVRAQDREENETNDE
jgi:hypothetical protein